MKLCQNCGKKYKDDIAFCPRDGQMLVEYSSPDGDDPLIGTLIEKKYRIEDKIAQGGMSSIYLATHVQLDLPVAVKVLHERLVPDENAIRRFRREAQSAMQIRHTNAIVVMDFGVTESNVVYLVMEYLQGMTLRQKLGREPLLPLIEVHSILQQICAAVKVAHRRGIVHRDLKPENIFLQRDGETEVVKVLDFGIAKLESFNNPLELQLTGHGNVLGSPHYMSPEQWSEEEVDVRSDIYSLGVMLFELLTGQLPFSAPNMAAMAYKHTAEPPPEIRALRPDLSASIGALVARTLEKDPALRPEDAGALAEELEVAFAPVILAATPAKLRLVPDAAEPMSGDSHVIDTLSGTTEWPSLKIPTNLSHLETSYSLDSIFLPEVFGLLARERVSGITWFSSGLIVKGLFWQDGDIVFAISNDLTEQLGERLVRQGRMQRKQLNNARDWLNEHQASIADALIALDYVTQEILMPLLSAHVYSVCYSLLDWEEGSYAFDPSPFELPIAVSPPLPAGELVLEAMRSILDLGRIKAFLGSPEQTWLAPAEWKVPDRITLRLDDVAVLGKLKTPQMISQVISALDLPEEQVLRTLCGLVALGALQRVEAEAAAVAAQATGGQMAEAPAQAPAPCAADVAAMALFCYEVENMLVQVNRPGIDHYGILGVSRQAGFEEIAAAYKNLKGQFDPASHQEIIQQMPTLASQLETICARLAEAYEMLSDAGKRFKYTQELKQQTGRLMGTSGPQPSVPAQPQTVTGPAPAETLLTADQKPQADSAASAAQADHKVPPGGPLPRAFADPSRLRNPDDWYLFGLELLERGDAERAVRAFQNALKRKSNDAEFHAALARAYEEAYGFNKQTIQEFEEAIALKPSSADYQAELGIFYLKHRQLEQAKQHIDHALAIDGDNRIARKAKLRIEQQK